MDISVTLHLKGLRHVADVRPSPQPKPRDIEKENCTKKVDEIDNAETSLWISSISFIITF